MGSDGTLTSLKLGEGIAVMAVPDTLVFGNWSISEEDQLQVIRNRASSSGCLYLTCSWFVFLSKEVNNSALIVENGKEKIGTLEQGRQALLVASAKAKLKVTSSFCTIEYVPRPTHIPDSSDCHFNSIHGRTDVQLCLEKLCFGRLPPPLHLPISTNGFAAALACQPLTAPSSLHAVTQFVPPQTPPLFSTAVLPADLGRIGSGGKDQTDERGSSR